MTSLTPVILLMLVAAFAFIQINAISIQDLKESVDDVDAENSEVQRSARHWGYNWGWPYGWNWNWWYRPWYPRRTSTSAPMTNLTSATTVQSNTTSNVPVSSNATTNSTPTQMNATTAPLGKRDLESLVEERFRRDDGPTMKPMRRNCSHHPGHQTMTPTALPAPAGKRHVNFAANAVDIPLPVNAERRHVGMLHP